MTTRLLSHKVQGLGHVEPEDLVLDGKKLDANISSAIDSIGLTRSIDDASTLTITLTDPERFLLAGGYYERRGDLLLDDLWFRLRSMDKAGDQFTLRFEDREVAMLRRHTKPARAVRGTGPGHSTRAEFLKRLVAEEPHIGFVCPELHTQIRIQKYSKADETTIKRDRARGLATDDRFTDTVGGTHTFTAAEMKNANRAMNVAQKLGAGQRAALALVEACIVEGPYFANPDGGDSTSRGILQLLAKTASGLGIDPLNIEACCNAFLTQGFTGAGGAIALARKNPGWTPGQIAQACQGSAYPDRYEQHRATADKLLDAYGGVDKGPTSDGTGTLALQTIFTRGQPQGPKGEDTWACGQRNAKVLGWRWFIVAGVVYLISDYDLIRSQPRISLDENSPGVDSIDFTLDDSKYRADEISVTARAGRWAAPPGTVVNLRQSLGPAAGAWIVSEVDRPDLYQDDCTITLVRPTVPKLEPAPQIQQRAQTSGIGASTTLDGGLNAGAVDGGATGLKSDSKVLKVYEKAAAIDRLRLPYVSGGGHNPSLAPSGGAGTFTRPLGQLTPGSTGYGYDCSGAVSAALAAGGLLVLPPYAPGTPVLAQDLVRYGAAGRGKYLTVWAVDEGGGNGHCFLEFTLPDRHVFFEAHHTGTIVGFETSRDTTGLVPRHWPGT